MNIADLYVRLRAEGVADVVGNLRAASGAFDALSQAAGQAALQAEQSAQAMRSAMSELGVISAGLFYALQRAAGLAAQEEAAVLRWRAILGERAETFFAAVREEVERTRYYFGGFSDMLEALLPAQQLVRADMENFIPLMRAVNEALIAAGLSGERLRYAWYAIAKAAVEGSAEFLAEGSRFLQAQIVQGEQATAILREMNKELGVQQNLRIILRAVLASERPEWDAVRRVVESSGGALRTFSGVLRETVQAVGKGSLEITASLARVFTGVLEWFQKTGTAAGVGRALMFGALTGMVVGLPAVLERIGGVLGRLLGLSLTGRTALLRLAAALATVGLVMEDVWMSLHGKEALFSVVWRWLGVEEAVQKLPEWTKMVITAAIGALTWKLAAYLITRGVLVKLGGAALITLGLVIGLEPLWRLIPGYEETVGQVVNKIPWALRMALMAAGFTLLGGKIAGGAGALLGFTLAVLLTLVWGMQTGNINEVVNKIPWELKLALGAAGFAILGWKLAGGTGALVGLVLGIVLTLGWQIVSGNLDQAVGGIHTALKAALMGAGFAILGWKLAGPVGGLVGFTIGALLTVLWDVTHKVQKPKGWGEAAGLPTEAWQTTVTREVERADVQAAMRAVAQGEWARFGQELEYAYLAQSESAWRTAWQNVAMQLKGLQSQTQVMYGATAATYAWLTAVNRVLAGIQDFGARLRAAETLIEAFQPPAEVAELVRWSAYEPEEAARMIAERAQVSVNVTIAPGAVRVEGGTTLPEELKEEIVNEAVRAVERGLRTALDEEVE